MVSFLAPNTLKTLGFSKTAVYDPTVEANTQDSNPLFKRVDPLPTGEAINLLANQWMYRKPAPQPHLNTKRFLKEYKEIK